MSDYRIYRSIMSGKRHISFHTPGHKGGGALAKLLPVAQDVTELSYTDDLFSPSGAIAAAQSDMAMIAGAKKAFITTDGSTSGILAMMYALSRRTKKVIIQRNSHKSVWNACSLFGIEPVILQGEEERGVLRHPSVEQVERAVAEDKEIGAMLVTTPDYYGNIAPMEKYAELLHSCGRLLVADGAHGAHLLFGKFNRAYAGAHADMWVDGAHKTLPVLTQGAAVFSNRQDLCSALEEGLSLFRTTSPSFPVMASVEFGYKYLSEKSNLAARAYELAESIGRTIYGLEFYPSADPTKLCADFGGAGIDAEKAQRQLEKQGIYPEFNDGRYVVFYLSPSTSPAHARKLTAALKRVLKTEELSGTYQSKPALVFGDKAKSYLAAVKAPFEYVAVSASVGRISACNAGVAPPCTPVIAAGEKITAECVKLLKNSAHTFGLNQGKIKTVKEK